jgi:hypothetical protein
MSNRDDGIKLNKENLVNNYKSLFHMMSGELNNNKMSFRERILLLNTILRDENGLKRLLEKSDNKSYNFFYYLLKKISNKKLKNIITNSQKNTGKKNLLEGILLEANELIKSIDTKEEERKILQEQQNLIKIQQEIKTKKTYILEYIKENPKYLEDKKKLTTHDNHFIEGKSINNNLKNYIILERKDHKETPDIDGQLRGYKDTTTIYYLLYKDQEIYTMKIVYLNNSKGYQKIHDPELLDIENYKLHDSSLHIYYYNYYYSQLLSHIYEDLKELTGGKLTTTPVYKLNGEKVSLLINKKKLYRSIYVKGNGNSKAKYCKINNEFVLLSKLKNKII